MICIRKRRTARRVSEALLATRNRRDTEKDISSAIAALVTCDGARERGRRGRRRDARAPVKVPCEVCHHLRV